jgi:hypothetical protein
LAFQGERNVYDAWTILQLLNIRRRALAIDVLSEKGDEVQFWKSRIDKLMNATTCDVRFILNFSVPDDEIYFRHATVLRLKNKAATVKNQNTARYVETMYFLLILI